MEVHRTVARRAVLGSEETESVNQVAGAGSRGGRPEVFQLKAPGGRAWEGETTAGSRPKPVTGDEMASVLTLYLREIGQVKLLAREEEVAPAQRIQEGDEAAREAMIKANLRLVVRIAHDYEGMGLPLLDLISEGNIGLMKAVDRYDLAKGAKLSVYASTWIKQRIRRALSNDARTVRVPVHLQDASRHIRAATLRLQGLLGRDPTSEEIAQESGLPAARARKIRQAMQVTISLDEPIDDRQERTFAETIADEGVSNPYEALAHTTHLQHVAEFFGKLSRREQTILRSRFGLEGEAEATLEEVGRQLGLTRERVRQMYMSRGHAPACGRAALLRSPDIWAERQLGPTNLNFMRRR